MTPVSAATLTSLRDALARLLANRSKRTDGRHDLRWLQPLRRAQFAQRGPR